MFVALDKAIRQRLTGEPLDSNGQPENPAVSPGIRIPVYPTNNNDFRTRQFDPFNVVTDAYKNVAIYKTSLMGVALPNVYPSVTYDFINFIPRFDQWLPNIYANRILAANQPPPVPFTKPDGTVVTPPPEEVTYPFAESYDVVVQLDIWSQIEYEAYTILHQMLLLFPQRGAINVPLFDGTTHWCDMLMTSDPIMVPASPTDLESPGGQQDTYRENRVILTYIVEAYVDTTWPSLQASVPRVTDVTTEMTTVDTPKARDVSETSGVLETVTFPAKP